jgi:hypothetical protein
VAWKKWFPTYRVPKEMDSLVNAGLLKDTTWKHDAAPNFDAVLASGATLTFWVEHPNPDKRITMDNRYAVSFAPPGSRAGKSVVETDDFDHAVDVLKTFIRESGGPRAV